MRYREGHKQRSHEQILDAAARIFRERGYVGGGVGTVMREAGMTKGGFYAHFDSKEDLLAQTLTKALEESFRALTRGFEGKSDGEWIEALLQRYLSRAHYQRVLEGCPLPTLLSEVGRAGPAARKAFQEYLERMTARLGQRLPGASGEQREEFALALLAMLVGGMTIARSVEDEELADRVLSACRNFLLKNLPVGEKSAEQAE